MFLNYTTYGWVFEVTGARFTFSQTPIFNPDFTMFSSMVNVLAL
jgi:hypothetical protein